MNIEEKEHSKEVIDRFKKNVYSEQNRYGFELSNIFVRMMLKYIEELEKEDKDLKIKEPLIKIIIGLYKHKETEHYDVMINKIDNTHIVHNGEFDLVKEFEYIEELEKEDKK